MIFFEEEGKFHILIPKTTNLKGRVRCDDDKFISFLEATLRIDPNLRISAGEGLKHPFLKTHWNTIKPGLETFANQELLYD